MSNDGNEHGRMPTEGSVPGWFVEGEAAAFAEQTEEAKFAHSLMEYERGRRVVELRDVGAAERVIATSEMLNLLEAFVGCFGCDCPEEGEYTHYQRAKEILKAAGRGQSDE